jgi:hypothetical protein
MEARTEELREKRDRAQFEAQLGVMAERENLMALALILLMVAMAAAYVGYQTRQQEGMERRTNIAFAIAAIAFLGAIILWVSRPGLDEVDRRVEAALGEDENSEELPASQASEGNLLCSIVTERSRVTGAKTDDVAFDWRADGCVNGRTQYGFANGDWNRVFVPNDEDAVAVNTYDPQTRTFRSDRYLLGRSDMQKAREARAEYTPPQCGVTDAARTLGEQQQGVLSLLPNRPNERLVYSCEPRAPGVGGGGGGGGEE